MCAPFARRLCLLGMRISACCVHTHAPALHVLLQVTYLSGSQLHMHINGTATPVCPHCCISQVYFMIGFANDAAKFWYYYLMTASTLLMMTSFGLFLVSATSMVELAQMLSGAINFLFNQFNGERQVAAAMHV